MDFGTVQRQGSFRKRKTWPTKARLWDFRGELDARLLWVLWLAGVGCVGTSIFATYILSTSFQPSSEESGVALNDPEEALKVTIYSAAAPFEGDVGLRQAMAIDSWLRLDPQPNVVLFARHHTAYAFASTRAPLVTVDTGIDFTFTGKPLFHGMVQRASNSSSNIVMVVHSRVILLQHVFLVLRTIHGIKQDWMVAAVPLLVPIFPFSLPGKTFQSLGVEVEDEQVNSYVEGNGVLDACDGAQLWAWNANQKPLYAGVMPPFVFGEGHHNQWLITEAIASKYRVVLDASTALSIFRIQDAVNDSIQSAFLTPVTKKTNKIWDISDNSWLASTYGSYYFRPQTVADISIKLVKCSGLHSEMFCLLNISQHHCSCLPMNPLANSEKWPSSHQQKGTWTLLPEPSTWTSWFEDHMSSIGRQSSRSWHIQGKSIVYSWVEKSMMFWKTKNYSRCTCNKISSHHSGDCRDSKLQGSEIAKFNVSYPLKWLLKQVANDDKVVILAVVGNSYRDMLMSWVCRLKHLHISNFLVSTLDDEIHHFATLQGLPVFRSTLNISVSRNDCHFGSECFQNVTKMKSHTVLQILKLGYHVLFSDVDIYWFQNPTKELSSFGPGHLPAQSDQWNETEPLNEPRRLNSGFYFARADEYIIAAFEKIIKHAASSNKSEQPSFYDTLCGADGEYRVGNDVCMEPELNVTVNFLHPREYPNGAYRGLWGKRNVRAACMAQGCKVLHNNWVPGRKKKLSRQISAGLWDYDASTRLCLTKED